MGAINPAEVLRVPGRLSYGCTDLSAVWPHGGTGLGSTKMIVVRKMGGAYPVTIEAFGGEPVEYLEPGEVWRIACVLRTIDDDAIGQVFPNTSTGTVSQRKVITAPGSVRAGNWMSGRALSPLVFTPEGATHAKIATQPDVDAKFVVLHKAIPLLREDLEIPLQRGQEWGIQVVFQGIRNAVTGGTILSAAARGDITL